MSGGDQETTDSEDSDSLAPCNNNINTQGLQQGTRPFDHDVEDNKRFSSSSSDDDGDIVGRHHEVWNYLNSFRPPLICILKYHNFILFLHTIEPLKYRYSKIVPRKWVLHEFIYWTTLTEYSRLIKKLDHWKMQFQSFDWLRGHGMTVTRLKTGSFYNVIPRIWLA